MLTTTKTTARLWPLDPLSVAEERKPRDLTPDEMDRYQIGPPDE